MGTLALKSQWHDAITQIEKGDFVIGGLNGVINKPAQQIAENILFLKDVFDDFTEQQSQRNNLLMNIKDFGGIGDGVSDDTKAFADAFLATKQLLLPAGTWLVDEINIPSDTIIVTQCTATIIKQKPQAGQKSCINILGSNIAIDTFRFIGNIATDQNEFNHAVKIYAADKDIKNIKLATVVAENVRGDVVYLGAKTGFILSNIFIDKVFATNVLRNGVSICGGSDIRINEVVGEQIGFMAFDIEPEHYNTPVNNIKVGLIKGRFAGINSASATAFIDNVIIDFLELNNDATSSQPTYTPGTTVKDALTIRNTKTVKIGNFSASSHDRCALFVMMGTGELGCENILIDKLKLSNISLTDTEYAAYLHGANIAKITVNTLDLEAANQTNKSCFINFKSVYLVNAKVNLVTGFSVIRNSPNSTIANLQKKDTSNQLGILLTQSNNSTIKNCIGTFECITAYSDKVTIANCNLIASVFIADNQNANHTIINSFLNSIYYGFSLNNSGYLNTISMGTFKLWFDTAGILRFKNGAPTSDTDGIPLSQQGIQAKTTYDPPSLTTNTQQSVTTTLIGAKVGDAVSVSFNHPLSGTRLWAEVTATDTVTVYHRNDTGATVDLPSGTLTVKII